MSLPPSTSLGSRASALVTAGVIGATTLLGGFSAAAQQALNKTQCFKAMSVAGGIMDEYKGKLSREFTDGLKAFVARDCDLKVEFKVMPGTSDKKAFEEFLLLVTAIRTADIGKPVARPAALTK